MVNKKLLHRPLDKVGNPLHSNGVYKHGDHNLVLADTSFHKSNLDSKEPILDYSSILHLQLIYAWSNFVHSRKKKISRYIVSTVSLRL